MATFDTSTIPSGASLVLDSKLAQVSNSIPGSADKTKSIPKGTIKQTERLYTTRSRSITYPGGGDRGQRAYIKILTNNTTNSIDRIGEGKDSKATSLTNGTTGVLNDAITGSGYANFLLTDVQCALDEKLQIVEVFGDAEVSYYFGRQPVMFNFSGVLMDSVDNNWFIEWLEMYSHVLRGSQLARNYELIKLVLPNMTLVGTITRTTWAQNSARDVDIAFGFSFLAKQIIPQPVTLPDMVLTNNANKISWGKVSHVTQSNINTIKLASSKLQSVIQNPHSILSDYSSAMSNFSTNSVALSDTRNSTNTSSVGNTNTSTSSLSNLFAGASSNLSGVRASLFSPVYGVLSSLTKLIKNVTGNISSVIKKFTTPINNILRDIRNISNQASGIVSLINNSINSITRDVQSFDNNLKSTLLNLKKTAGVIAHAPDTIRASIQKLVHAGKLPITAGFISGKGTHSLGMSGKHQTDKLVLLNSGAKHVRETGAVI